MIESSHHGQVRRDPASHAALPAVPQARASPEAVVSAALRALSNRDTWQVWKGVALIHTNTHGMPSSVRASPCEKPTL